MKTTKAFDGKKFHYYFNGENFRNSSKDFKFACIATSRENGKQWVVSLGNNQESTRNSMAHCYAHYCDLEVIEVAAEQPITIEYQWFGGRYMETDKANVTRIDTYQGHDIYQEESNGWFFLQAFNRWQYFGTINEVRRFIRDTQWT